VDGAEQIQGVARVLHPEQAPRFCATGGTSAKAAGNGSKNNPQNITIIWRRMVFLIVEFFILLIILPKDSCACVPS